MKFERILLPASLSLLFLGFTPGIHGQRKVVALESQAPISTNTTSGSSLIDAARASKASSEQLLKSQEEELKQATAKLEQLRQLVAEGLVARNELLEQDHALAFLQGSLNGTRQQIADSEQLIAGLVKQEEIRKTQAPAVTKYRSLTAPTILRHGGSAGWSIANLSQVQAFFSYRFGRMLPTSAVGQSTTHNRLGWDHRNAVDVALHPDSAEGKALIGYLQSAGIPYLAFRAAVAGVATGPHIHIGSPSHRLV